MYRYLGLQHDLLKRELQQVYIPIMWGCYIYIYYILLYMYVYVLTIGIATNEFYK